MFELSVGFETNLNVNAERKRVKYNQLTSSDYHDVRFINLSLSALGVVGNYYYHSIDLLYILHA